MLAETMSSYRLRKVTIMLRQTTMEMCVKHMKWGGGNDAA